jgi:hypothetical protein
MSDVRRRMDSSSDGGKRAKGSPTVFNKENIKIISVFLQYHWEAGTAGAVNVK